MPKAKSKSELEQPLNPNNNKVLDNLSNKSSSEDIFDINKFVNLEDNNISNRNNSGKGIKREES